MGMCVCVGMCGGSVCMCVRLCWKQIKGGLEVCFWLTKYIPCLLFNRQQGVISGVK